MLAAVYGFWRLPETRRASGAPQPAFDLNALVHQWSPRRLLACRWGASQMRPFLFQLPSTCSQVRLQADQDWAECSLSVALVVATHFST